MPRPRINIDQAIRQIRDCSHRFDLNIYSFVGRSQRIAKSVFQDAFFQRKFQSDGAQTWDPGTKPLNRARLYRGGLIESRSLLSSIKVKPVMRTAGIETIGRVYTDPTAFTTTMANSGFCFAAVHNNPNGSQWNQVENLPMRQFMPNEKSGDSTVVHERIKSEVYPVLFELIPGSFT